jgi:two-component system sensor kinase
VLANNGLEAIRAVEADPDRFHLVLMDMQMPELDGYGAARRLREAGYARPIIALTANAMSGDRERCLAAGCSHYLTKPINRQALIRTCEESTEPESTLQRR